MVSYSATKSVRGGVAVEHAIGMALRFIAAGSSIRAAQRKFDVPFSSLHTAWVDMGGQQGNMGKCAS